MRLCTVSVSVSVRDGGRVELDRVNNPNSEHRHYTSTTLVVDETELLVAANAGHIDERP